MSDYVALTCPSCGGKLQITPDIERFACSHCGNEHIVRRGGGIVSLAPVVEQLSKVRLGVDKTASELAINRLKKKIRASENRLDDLRRKHEAEIRDADHTYTSSFAELSTLEQKKQSQNWSLVVIVICAIILAIITIVLASSIPSSNSGICYMLGFGFPLFAIFVVWLARTNTDSKISIANHSLNNIRDIKDKEIERLKNQYFSQENKIEEELVKLQAELNHHEQIVAN